MNKAIGIIIIVYFFGGALSCALHNDDANKNPAVHDNNKMAMEAAPKSLQQRNKEIVLDFYQKVFGEKNIDSIDEFVDAGPENYIQHSPYLPNGREPLKEAAKKWFAAGPWEVEVKKVAAEGDLVFLHVRAVATFLKTSFGGKATAIVDILRLKNGKIVEHWAVIQPIPDGPAANDHPFF